MSVATIKPTTASQPKAYMCGSVLTYGKKPKDFLAPTPYKPTHTVSPAGLPVLNDQKPFKAQHDFAMRLMNTEAQQRYAELLQQHATDNDSAAELLRQTHASLAAARELQEIERLGSMGLSKEKIAEVMENRLQELARRQGHRHDTHHHVMEQIGHLAKHRASRTPGLALNENRGVKQPMSTREGLMNPQFDFTQKEVNTMRNGLLAFSKAQRESQLESMQKDQDESVADALTEKGPGKSQAEKRLNELIAAGAYKRATPTAPAVGGPPNPRPTMTPAVGGGMAVSRGRPGSASAILRRSTDPVVRGDLFATPATATDSTPAHGGAGAPSGGSAYEPPSLSKYETMSKKNKDHAGTPCAAGQARQRERRTEACWHHFLRRRKKNNFPRPK